MTPTLVPHRQDLRVAGAPRPPPDNDLELGVGKYGEDEDLLARVCETGLPQVRVIPWQGPVTLVLGHGSRAGVESVLATCRVDGVPVLRRRGGGCAVVLDPGNVIVSAVLPAPGLGSIRGRFALFSDWVLGGLVRLGLPEASRRDVSDLCLGDRKIGGASLFLGRGLAYYCTTLLHSPDLERWARYLPHPPREPAYRRGRAHVDFVTTLGAVWGRSPSDLAERLSETLGKPALG